MNRIISFVLLCAILLMCFSGCSISNGPNGEKESRQGDTTEVNDGKNNAVPVIVEGELDKNSDLVATLLIYLEQYLTQYNIRGRSFAEQIDHIENGIQPILVAFDPADYYFVCGYYDPPADHYEFGYCCADNYTWVGYRSVAEIREYYKGMKWAVAFQINRALTVTDITASVKKVPNMEHFQLFKPTFEDGVNVSEAAMFDETFIYLNYPDCDLNGASQNPSTMYYCNSIYYHSMNTIPCVCLDGKYYLSFYMYTVYKDGTRGEESDRTYDFGEYYDPLMSMMEREKYNIVTKNGNTSFFATISLESFVDILIK